MISVDIEEHGGKNLLMAGVADNEANIIFAGKVHSSNNLITGRDINGVTDVVAERAWLGLGGERIACLVRKVCLHHRRRGVKASGDQYLPTQ